MTKLSKDNILKLTHLTHISLNNNKIKHYTKKFNAILNYINQLKSININNLLPTNQITNLTNIIRNNTIKSYNYNPTILLKNIPTIQDNQIKMQKIIK